MATILEFPASLARGQSSGALSGVPAEVVMFPGVRYEQFEAAQKVAAKKRPSSRRDHLELED